MTQNNDCCPTCGHDKIILDDKIGELYCVHCGFVISENVVNIESEWRSFSGDTRNRVGDPTSILVHDMGLSTIIGKKNQDVKGKPISSKMKNSKVLTSLSTISKNSIPPLSGVKSPTNPDYSG